MIAIVLLASAIPVHVCAYKILMIPVVLKSHAFSSFAIAEGLLNGGHNVSLFISENYFLDLPPELRNRSEFSVVRYRVFRRTGVRSDGDAYIDNLRKKTIESGSSESERSPAVMKMYDVYLFFTSFTIK